VRERERQLGKQICMVELCFCICFHELEIHRRCMRLCLACEFWLYCFMTERRCFVACCKIINRFVLLLHSLDLSAGVLRIHISVQQVIPLQVCFFFISFFATLNPNPLLCFLCDVCRHEVGRWVGVSISFSCILPSSLLLFLFQVCEVLEWHLTILHQLHH
jgi:hypothetical protein